MPFVDYYLSDEGLANVSEVGYVQLPADELEATRAAWAAATGAGDHRLQSSSRRPSRTGPPSRGPVLRPPLEPT